MSDDNGDNISSLLVVLSVLLPDIQSYLLVNYWHNLGNIFEKNNLTLFQKISNPSLTFSPITKELVGGMGDRAVKFPPM